MAMSANSGWLDQFEEGNTAGGHAGEVEAIPHPAISMTTRRFPAPWRAELMPGGYVVRDAKDNEVEAMQAKPRPQPRGAAPSRWSLQQQDENRER
jgi:hypothetical protein